MQADKVPSIVDESDRFLQTLSETLLETQSESFNLDSWFNNSLKLLIKQLIAKRSGENHNMYSLVRVLEMINSLAFEKQSEDTKYIAEIVRFTSTEDGLAADLINSIMNIVKSGSPTGGDIIKLHRIYQVPNPPDIGYLRAADIMEALLRDSFAPGHPTSHMKEKLWLLAYGAFGGPTSTKESVELGHKKLIQLDHVLTRITSMSQIHEQFDSILELLLEPICSTALVMWLKRKLFDDEFYEWTAFTMGDTPMAFHILDEIAINHPTHRAKVFDIWLSLFERNFDMLDAKIATLVVIQFREKFLDHFVLLFHLNFGKQILSYLAQKAEAIDPSLIVYFLNKIIPDLEMPLPVKIYGIILRMLIPCPASTVKSSQAISRLLSTGNHMDLPPEDAILHEQLETAVL
ncbi:Negative elongation factor C/D [Terramyces sp. JEL0728]|nr:Negative elongation factor C/D [Terramyces sp. JEL0728]